MPADSIDAIEKTAIISDQFRMDVSEKLIQQCWTNTAEFALSDSSGLGVLV